METHRAGPGRRMDMTWEILSCSDSKTCLTFWGVNCIECVASDNNICIKRLLRRLNEVKFMDPLAQRSSVRAGMMRIC